MKPRIKRDYFSLKTKLTILTVTVSLVVTIFLSSISFLFLQSYVRQNLIQTTEFNLQLVSGTAAQSISDINTLGLWISFNSLIAQWCDNPASTEQDAIPVFDRVKEEFQNNKANAYIKRLIITDINMSKFIQVGSNLTESLPVTVYTLQKLPLKVHAWQELCTDPYDLQKKNSSKITAAIFPLVYPIYRPGSSVIIGYVFISADSAFITNQLKNYTIMKDSNLYLTINGNSYCIDGNVFTPVKEEQASQSEKLQSYAQNPQTKVTTATNGKDTNTFVSFPVKSTIYLTHKISHQLLSAQQNIFYRMLFIICIGIVLMGSAIFVMLYRTITVPVYLLRKQLARIEEGKFSVNKGIEWKNELGDIGRGINSLSTNITALMEKRVADEKNKRILEYRMLQGQINPHFLYNTLNSIKWMASIQNATGIAEMTTALARLLKNIAKDSDSVISLEKELALLDDYFLIQQYRYGGSITLAKEIDPDVLQTGIPRFSLQPLMENAIFHGIEPTGSAGTISITAKFFQLPQTLCKTGETTAVQITLTDNGTGMTEDEIRGIFDGSGTSTDGLFKNVGILNVHKRIQYEFGSEYGLSIVSEKGKYTTITIEVPAKNV